jgi:uncharacterized membrane protein YgdD (TMEM256/DUF423 family)
MSTFWSRAVIAIAGLMGAAGIVLAALGAHGSGYSRLATAAPMLLLHAPVILVIVLLISQGLARRWLAISAAIGFAVGATLFATDLAMRDLAGHALFGIAAPAGGTILIASWLALAASGLFASRRIG